MQTRNLRLCFSSTWVINTEKIGGGFIFPEITRKQLNKHRLVGITKYNTICSFPVRCQLPSVPGWGCVFNILCILYILYFELLHRFSSPVLPLVTCSTLFSTHRAQNWGSLRKRQVAAVRFAKSKRCVQPQVPFGGFCIMWHVAGQSALHSVHCQPRSRHYGREVLCSQASVWPCACLRLLVAFVRHPVDGGAGF